MTGNINFYNGCGMPAIGLGTWECEKDRLIGAVKEALDTGYRHIDTAFEYLNEESVGQALEDYITAGKVKREELFIVTKLPGIHMERSKVRRSLEISLKRLRLQYIDLYLVHTPVGFKHISDDQPVPLNEKNEIILDYSTDLLDIWKEMEKLVDAGLTKFIGMSNFNSEQVERICKMARIKPVTNQIECHLHFPNTKLAEFCRDRDITVTAYSPLGAPGLPPFVDRGDVPRLLDDQTVTEVARKYKKTPAQVLLKSLLQKGYAVIPRSTFPERIKENFQVSDFNISDEDMERLDNIKHYPRIFGAPLIKDDHPEFPWASPD